MKNICGLSPIAIQKILRKKSGISNEAVTEQFKKVTNGYGQSLVHLPEKEFQSACEGAYANITLKLPELNFAAALRNVQASNDSD